VITINIEYNFDRAGIILPEVAKPLASYVPGLIAGDLVYISGQLPIKEGKVLYTGKLGKELTVEDGQQASRLAVINCLAVLKSCLADWSQLERIIKISGYIQSDQDFFDQPKVLNGASDLLVQIFGELGQHARAAIGVNALPLNAACEIEMIAKIKT
jgi:enamine deaminase RidA (YjgF/YER057c/UK114 family)